MYSGVFLSGCVCEDHLTSCSLATGWDLSVLQSVFSRLLLGTGAERIKNSLLLTSHWLLMFKWRKNNKTYKYWNFLLSDHLVNSPDSIYITYNILLFCVSVATTNLEKAKRLPFKFNAHTTPPHCFSTSPWDAERAKSAWCWWRVWAGPPSYSWTSCLRCPTGTTGQRLPWQHQSGMKRGVDGTA